MSKCKSTPTEREHAHTLLEGTFLVRGTCAFLDDTELWLSPYREVLVTEVANLIWFFSEETSFILYSILFLTCHIFQVLHLRFEKFSLHWTNHWPDHTSPQRRRGSGKWNNFDIHFFCFSVTERYCHAFFSAQPVSLHRSVRCWRICCLWPSSANGDHNHESIFTSCEASISHLLSMRS